MLSRLAAILFALLLPGLAAAQDYPAYDNIWVNDQANIIDDTAEVRITGALQTLGEETGVQATVLTLHTRWGYPGESLEDFATGLFNDWGIGDAERNDGILVLVLSDDREMRVELGSGYGTGYNGVAQDIIDEIFIPAFGSNDFSGGIERGTNAVIERIARPQVAGVAPVRSSGGSGPSGGAIYAVLGTLMAGFIGFGIFGRRILDRFTRCPSCGARGIHTEREVIQRATRSAPGEGEKTVTCPHCGYRDRSRYTISRVRSSSSSGGSFGGGSSSGGGASGRW